MSDDDEKQTNKKSIGNYDHSRFNDAAHSIYYKYQMMGLVKASDENINAITSSSTQIDNHRRETVVNSRACTIL